MISITKTSGTKYAFDPSSISIIVEGEDGVTRIERKKGAGERILHVQETVQEVCDLINRTARFVAAGK